MSLFDLFIVSGSPISDAIETECVATILKYTESLSVCKYFFKANYALVISFVTDLSIFANNLLGSISAEFIDGSHTSWVHVLTVLAIFAITLEEILTNYPVFVIFEEIIDYVIIFVTFLLLWFLSDANFHDFS